LDLSSNLSDLDSFAAYAALPLTRCNQFEPLSSARVEMDDLEPFESPKLLVDGAKTSIPAFEAACNDFVASCTYDVIDYADPNTREKIKKLRFHQKTAPLRLIASRILNDLRHALDQAVSDGAVSLGRSHARGIHFPFGKSVDDYNREVKDRLKNVDADFVAHIRTFKAHYGGDDELYAFGSLSGPNKHQRILRISLDNTSLSIGPGPNGFRATGPLTIGGGKWNDLRNELEIMRASPGAVIEGDLNFTPSLQIVIGIGEAPLSGSAVIVFADLASKIESIVFSLEAETARIKTLKGF
jgi:hypothetical protein